MLRYALVAAMVFAVVLAEETAAPPAEEEASTATPQLPSAPVLILHKAISESHIAEGASVVVTTTLINFGTDVAHSVTVTDGSETKSAATLAPGENITVTYSITGTAAGNNIVLPFATATYKATSDAESPVLKVVSNLVREEERDHKVLAAEDMAHRGNVEVVTATEYERLTSNRVIELIISAIIAGSLTGFPFLMYRSKQQQIHIFLSEQGKGKK